MITAPKDKAERDERLDLVMRTIEANPQHWQQCNWHCGTSHCFAGFAQCFAYDIPWAYEVTLDDSRTAMVIGKERHNVSRDAALWLGIQDQAVTDSYLEEYWDDDFEQPDTFSELLFDGSNSLLMLRRIVNEIKQTPYECPAP